MYNLFKSGLFVEVFVYLSCIKRLFLDKCCMIFCFLILIIVLLIFVVVEIKFWVKGCLGFEKILRMLFFLIKCLFCMIVIWLVMFLIICILCVIKIIVKFNFWFKFCNKVKICLVVLGLRVEVDLFEIKIFGLLVKVCVMVICCFCFLDSCEG